MTTREPAIIDYEATLIEKKSRLSASYFQQSDSNELLALTIFKYVIENYLNWSPEEAQNWLSYDIVKRFKLSFVFQFIRFPPELDPIYDMFYITWKIYPQLKPAKYPYVEIVLRNYCRVLNSGSLKIVKEFFSGIEGQNRAFICLRYCIQHFFSYNGVKDLYRQFSNRDIQKRLMNYKLSTALVLFMSPLEYLHLALIDTGEESDIWYHYYQVFGYHASNRAIIRKS